MLSIANEIVILVLLLLVNGIFVLAEIAVISARKTRLQHRANQGDKRAGAALELAQSPNDFLSTVQIGITLINILLGAVSESTLSTPVAEALRRWSLTNPYAEALASGSVVVLITALTLLVGELIPKRLALHRPENIAAAMAATMSAVAKMFSPLVWLLGKVTDLILKLIGINPSKGVP
jgi:putative hemolysin